MKWTDFETRLDRAAAATFDEDVMEVRPMKQTGSVNAPSVVDGDRGRFSLTGSFERHPPRPFGSEPLYAVTGVEGGLVRYEALFTCLIGADWPYQPRKGDRAVIADGHWRIEEIDRDGSRRIAIHLNKASA